MTARFWCSLALLSLSCGGPAYAHKASDSLLHLDVDGPYIEGRWDIALRDLEFAIGLDTDSDGAITWGEVRGAQPEIEALARDHLALSVEGWPCPLRTTQLRIAEHSDGHYAALDLRAECPATIRQLKIRYDLFFDLDTQHRGLFKLGFGTDATQAGIFSPERRTLRFESGGSGVGRTVRQYLIEGIRHVWTGLDHMLFLAGLFLPAVLYRRQGRWIATESLGAAVRATTILVTAFTVAHAVTLCLAATGAFSLPSRLVESLVAATVMFAGLNNLIPMVHRRLVWLAAGFGLIHGAAIASALLDLGLPASGRVWALLSFNFGVEAAQLALVACLIPIAFALRRRALYRNGVLIPGSVAITLIGLGWLIERAFVVDIGAMDMLGLK